MNTAERIQQVMLLAMLDGWDRERLGNEVRERYPLGPTPQGPAWTDAMIDDLWNAVSRAQDSDDRRAIDAAGGYHEYMESLSGEGEPE